MRTLTFTTAIAVMFAAGPAFAGQDKKADDPANAEKRICRKVEVTGSIMGKRECRTAAEWKAQQESDAANVDQMRNHNGGGMRTN